MPVGSKTCDQNCRSYRKISECIHFWQSPCSIDFAVAEHTVKAGKRYDPVPVAYSQCLKGLVALFTNSDSYISKVDSHESACVSG